MAKFVKKPVVVDGIQWNGKNTKEIENMLGAYVIPRASGRLVVGKEESGEPIIARISDWIIKDEEGLITTQPAAIFHTLYLPRED